jgi:hypothetical protein
MYHAPMFLRTCLLPVVLSAPLIAQSSSLPEEGFASKYPGDVGIEKDPHVVFVEDFEHPNLDAMWARWDTASSKPSQSFSNDVPAGSPGKQSLLFDRQTGAGPQLYRRIANKDRTWGYDRLFVRYYVKFAADCGEVLHFGPALGGNLPATPWPVMNGGVASDGSKSFWSGVEPGGKTWTWDFYTYWCDMRGSARGKYWGNSFLAPPKPPVERDKWICVEQMLSVNDVGDHNGEQAFWIDGKLISHLGKGFPKGRWVYDKFLPGEGGEEIRLEKSTTSTNRHPVPKDGAPFEGFRWRTVRSLKVNCLWVYIYTEQPDGHRIRVLYDHIVLATERIGPMVSP